MWRETIFNSPAGVGHVFFGGHEYDTDTGLSYMNARYYDSGTGRFISQDAAYLAVGDSNKIKAITKQELQSYLSDPQGFNSYAYARNNPLRIIDSDGQWFKEVLTGQQSWSSFMGEVGQATQYMGSGWQTAMDHPYVPAIVGTLPLAGYGATGGLTALSNAYLQGAGTACVAFCDKAGQTLQRTPQALGKIGEIASGLEKNTERIPSVSNTAKYRIPDGLNHASKTISEVKNVGYQSLTNQLRDSLSYAQSRGYRFDLYIRPDTKLSGPLQQVINSGQIIIKNLNNLK